MKYHYETPQDRFMAAVRAVLLYGILIMWACAAIIPMVWVFINSFKESNEILKNSTGHWKIILQWPIIPI